ncbi:MAG: phosphate ABC transporter permease PstA [Magnetococcales bacterium]|nr:phosphate ABC transporter permease PstA [Magnetococcales bacterium]MBF0151951.1 phosphate ABC transporter permease PstA [Magnetococcales bacterium]MBF0175024.1 phosphate ABC transporter permease PstA [Magnetococcales bacterium]MBF0348186.1 phosphate ABC transporter permease PstA [Magnetococcales bacterium]
MSPFHKITPEQQQHLARRHRASRRFRRYGIIGLGIALAMLLLLLGTMVFKGYNAFFQTRILLDIPFDPSLLDPEGNRSPASLDRGDYRAVLKKALNQTFPEVRERNHQQKLHKLLSDGAPFQLQTLLKTHPEWLSSTQGVWLIAADEVDMWIKGEVPRNQPEAARHISDKQAQWIDWLEKNGRLHQQFNQSFFLNGDSRNPELAGILGAIKGSTLTLLITFLVSFPLGVASAVYLEEFANKGRWADVIEVNINNLAAVPSIVFGLLGLALYLNLMHLPRSAPLVGGLTLAMMTLPTLVIATRASLKSVPDAIRDGARALGASPLQVVLHHVLPLAAPGMLTGTIISMARALGETAPLLMIGMVAFIMDVPEGVMDPATVLPVQIFLWADSPERAFLEKTAGATLILLVFLIAMNALAVYIRNRVERRW